MFRMIKLPMEIISEPMFRNGYGRDSPPGSSLPIR